MTNGRKCVILRCERGRTGFDRYDESKRRCVENHERYSGKLVNAINSIPAGVSTSMCLKDADTDRTPTSVVNTYFKGGLGGIINHRKVRVRKPVPVFVS